MKHRLLLLLVMLLAVFSVHGAEETRYDGKPLAFWLDELKSDDPLLVEEAILVLTDAGPAARAAVPRLQMLLKDQPRSVRLRAALALWRIAGQTKPAIAALTEALHDPGAANRAEMLSKLGEIGSAAASSAAVVLPFLRDADGAVRTQARMAMQRFGAAAVPSILLALKDDKPSVRQAAFDALGLLGPSAKESVPTLTGLLEDADAEVCRQALIALGRIGAAAHSATPAIVKLTHHSNARLRAASLTTLQMIPADPPIARRAARNALEDEDLLVRSRGVILLWHVAPNDPDILLHALDLLKQPIGRAELLVLLGQMGPRAARAVPALTKLLEDTDPATRRLAIQALGRIGHAARPAAIALTRQLRSPDFAIRQDVVTALRAIGGDSERVVPALLEISKQDLTTRSMILPLLADYGPQAAALAVPWLIEQLHRAPSSYVTVQTAETLHKIDPERARKEAVPVLRKMLQPAGPWRVYAAIALRRLQPDSDEALKTLIDCLTSRNVGDRQQACRFLGTLGKSADKAAPALRKALRDADSATRVLAAGALWKISGETAATVPVLLEGLKPLPGNYWRFQAASILGEMGPAVQSAALPALRKYRDDADPSVRAAIHQAIERIDGPTAKTPSP